MRPLSPKLPPAAYAAPRQRQDSSTHDGGCKERGEAVTYATNPHHLSPSTPPVAFVDAFWTRGGCDSRLSLPETRLLGKSYFCPFRRERRCEVYNTTSPRIGLIYSAACTHCQDYKCLFKRGCSMTSADHATKPSSPLVIAAQPKPQPNPKPRPEANCHPSPAQL